MRSSHPPLGLWGPLHARGLHLHPLVRLELTFFLAAQFEADGYLVIRDFFSKQQAGKLLETSQRLLRDFDIVRPPLPPPRLLLLLLLLLRLPLLPFVLPSS